MTVEPRVSEGPKGDVLESIWAEVSAEAAAKDAADAAEHAQTEGPTTPEQESESQADASTTDGEGDSDTPESVPESEGEQPTEGPADTSKGSRRAKNAALEQQIRSEYEARIADLNAKVDSLVGQISTQVRTDLDARDAERLQTQQRQEDLRLLQNLGKGHQDGDWESTKALADHALKLLVSEDGTKPPKLVLDSFQQGRESLTQEIAAEFPKLKELPGLPQDGYTELLKAPSVIDLARAAFALGQRAVETTHTAALAEKDESIALLKGQLTELKGKLAGKGPSPEGAGGLRKPVAHKPAESFEEAVAQAYAELGGVPPS